MGITPIERLRAWWAGLNTPDPLKCDWCKGKGETFSNGAGYRYCSTECEQHDADEAWDRAF